MTETFSQFKTRFYAKVPDISILDCEEFNLLKVVLDGLKVNYESKGITRQIIFKDELSGRIENFSRFVKYFIKIRKARKRCRLFSLGLARPYLLFDNGRVSLDSHGNSVSYYFNRIERYLGSDKCVTLYQQNTVLQGGESMGNLFLATYFNSFTNEAKMFVKQLKEVYSRVEALGTFDPSELLNIRVAINKFFDEYWFWRYFLENSKIKYALFDEHYHREGFILALKRKGIKVVELQHGLIAPEDIFYVFPKEVKARASRALFPDKIFTYGQYWSDILLKGSEFQPQQIDVLGSYQEINTFVSDEQNLLLDSFTGNRPFILVTTQTFLHPQFMDYIKFLSSDLQKVGNDTRIIVKNHPSEKVANYEGIMNLSNVKIMNINTDYLLSRCSWHISSFSTTLYDAIRYNCTNYSIFIERCEDYIHTFVQEGISTLIYPRENPVLNAQKGQNVSAKLNRSHIYADFDQNKHKLLNI